jgi:hypothetical protein
MKKFVINLFSNRFGIILAALNVCYFMSKGEGLLRLPFEKLFACANLPALISTALTLEFIKIFSHRLSHAAEMMLGNTFFPFFIVLQWLFIAWIAKTLAAKIQRPKL